MLDIINCVKIPSPEFHSSAAVFRSNVQSVWNSFPLTIGATCHARLKLLMSGKI